MSGLVMPYLLPGRRLAIAAVAALSLAGCAKDPTTGQVSLDPNAIKNAQLFAQAACGVAPAVESIIALFNAGVASTAAGLAEAVCSLVPKQSGALRSARHGPSKTKYLGTLQGVKVYGRER